MRIHGKERHSLDNTKYRYKENEQDTKNQSMLVAVMMVTMDGWLV